MQKRDERAKYIHAWNQVSEIGPRRLQKLLDIFGCPRRAWEAPEQELRRVEGFSKNLAEKVHRQKQAQEPAKLWEEIRASGVSLLLSSDAQYPPDLKQIYDPPAILYGLGNLALLRTPMVAVVGSRRHTHYGKQVARRLAAELVSRGITVTSGMARGIDTHAHEGALEQGGKTIAVLGCGLDICYPPENRALKQRIQEQGLVISEFPPGTKPAPLNFPRRNRIISGLSAGTVVVEAGVKSGALITAEFSLEQGREVFAVPGSVESPYSSGCHKLLKEGAKLVESAADILEELALFGPGHHGPNGAGAAFPGGPSSRETLPLEAGEAELLEILHYEPVSLEELAGMSQVPLPGLNYLLLEMEMKGLIKQLPGKYFVRNTPGGV